MQPTENPLVRARALEVRSPYNRVLAILLCAFFGVFGIHRFYVGRWFTALLLLFTGGGFGVIWLIDLLFLAMGRFKDSEGRVLGPPQLAYDQLPAPAVGPSRRLPAKKSQPVEPELAPLDDDEPKFDEDVMADPLEEKFAELEKEMHQK